jgi:hypothetical protein
MGSIAGGNTTLRSSRVGCQNEQSTDQEMEPVAEVFCFSFCPAQKEVGWQSENCHVSESIARLLRAVDAQTSVEGYGC